MSLFSRWFRGRSSASASQPKPFDLSRPSAPGERVTYNAQVAGAHYRAEAVQAIAQRHGARGEAIGNVIFRVLLVPEPTNEHDPNAIRVLDATTGAHLGYVPVRSQDGAPWTERYRPVFDLLTAHGYVGACQAKLVPPQEGWPDIGIALNVRPPRGLLKDVREGLHV